MTRANKPAFARPCGSMSHGDREEFHQERDGITFRELASLHAMQGLLATGYLQPNETLKLAEQAVQCADALVRRLNSKEGNA